MLFYLRIGKIGNNSCIERHLITKVQKTFLFFFAIIILKHIENKTWGLEL